MSRQLTCEQAEKKLRLKRKEVVSQVVIKKGEEKENHMCNLMCGSNLSYLRASPGSVLPSITESSRDLRAASLLQILTTLPRIKASVHAGGWGGLCVDRMDKPEVPEVEKTNNTRCHADLP